MTNPPLGDRLRLFEELGDRIVPPDTFIIVRLDGRGFSKLTRKHFVGRFDERFRDMMIETTEALMFCGFKIIYGHTHSDEISLLFSRDDATFGRRVNKILTTLASVASAKFTSLLGDEATFDARILQLPSTRLIHEYFKWRASDCLRNASMMACHQALLDSGLTSKKATSALKNKSFSEQNEILFEHGINFNDLPTWQKRGVGILWESYEKSATNPITGEAVTADRRRLAHVLEVPTGTDFNMHIQKMIFLSIRDPDDE